MTKASHTRVEVMTMAVVLGLLACLVVPFLVFGAEGLLLDWLVTDRPPRLLRRPAAWLGRHLPHRGRQAVPLPPVLLALELRRLAVEIRRVEADNQPAKAARLAASTSAYDYVLLAYCRSVDVPVPSQSSPLTDRQRFSAEEALIGAGHDW
jgi:hypothetical protein